MGFVIIYVVVGLENGYRNFKSSWGIVLVGLMSAWYGTSLKDTGADILGYFIPQSVHWQQAVSFWAWEGIKLAPMLAIFLLSVAVGYLMRYLADHFVLPFAHYLLGCYRATRS